MKKWATLSDKTGHGTVYFIMKTYVLFILRIQINIIFNEQFIIAVTDYFSIHIMFVWPKILKLHLPRFCHSYTTIICGLFWTTLYPKNKLQKLINKKCSFQLQIAKVSRVPKRTLDPVRHLWWNVFCKK